MKNILKMALILVIMGFAGTTHAYPLDGYDTTGIRRIEAARLAVLGELRGRQQPPGALLPMEKVDLRLLDYPTLELPEPDPAFTAQIVALLGAKADRYGLAVLDLSDPDNPSLAAHRDDFRINVGSVGKIMAALAVFQTLADIYPDEVESRKKILRDTIITADAFIQQDHHKVRIWNLGTKELSHRRLQIGDRGSFYDFLDWTLSASSNAAASMVMKHAMLLRHFGPAYPVSEDRSERFFKETSKAELKILFEKTFFDPVTLNGLNLEYFRQGSFFTRYGKQQIPGTTSYGTARELMRFILRMEQGRLVDMFSSREIKRLLYMTERRIRYASSPSLRDSAVYFKSGSLYSCKSEPGFVCKKYRGNVKNYMNSVAIVETPAGVKRLYYLVTLISNVLYKNSAVDHQTLATRIHKMIDATHPPEPVPTGKLPPEVTFGRDLIGYTEKQKKRMHIAEAQAELAKLGCEVGKVDGIYGPKTATCIRTFQTAHQLEVDGLVTEELLKRLRAANAGGSPGELMSPKNAREQ